MCNTKDVSVLLSFQLGGVRVSDILWVCVYPVMNLLLFLITNKYPQADQLFQSRKGKKSGNHKQMQ